ncbi:S8 family serine peptidase [Nocardia otitidiscaviarum]|uniref:S8 family peptidase n=1 Tax=Nocardia otitidiscaviarum TaxID=1823 RepID=UPI0018934219|nr:S8 family serine peptidase [Nocardia otitidiscaviarum]MBF6236843.1 S8 family serine peptidase [Nocardia otitidiscaviarum]
MPTANFGTKDEPGFELEQSPDLIVVRARYGRGVPLQAGSVRTPVSGVLEDASLVQTYPEAGVEVYRIPPGSRSVEERKTRLNAAPEVRFAGHVLVDPVGDEPVLYTENIFVKFVDEADPRDCEAVLREAGLSIKQRVDYAENAYFAAAPEGTGQRTFDIANTLLRRADVIYSHPELIRRRARKAVFPPQWHLRTTVIGGVTVDAHANVEAAHAVTRGSGAIVAVVDDGVDIDHPEFAGTGKVVAPRDATLRTDDPRPKDPFGTGPDFGDNHGTACAGVACANGALGASGVAPDAALMPIRLASGLGSQAEAQAFQWAADHGADVISCSWGPADGLWFRPDDPAHQRVVPMPASTRLAIDYVITKGRGGKGCVICFAAGNGNESVDNDGYASHPSVIAVAACNDTGKRSVYSDFGKAVWCAFPSNDFGHAPFGHPDPLTPGIWTVDRRGADGYNPGDPEWGDAAGHFTNSFGGTSSACPGAAGVAALVLSVRPELTWRQVKDLLQGSCDRIDSSGGGYDAAGHSARYGFGRLNALAAVQAAQAAVPDPVPVV